MRQKPNENSLFGRDTFHVIGTAIAVFEIQKDTLSKHRRPSHLNLASVGQSLLSDDIARKAVGRQVVLTSDQKHCPIFQPSMNAVARVVSADRTSLQGSIAPTRCRSNRVPLDAGLATSEFWPDRIDRSAP